MSEYTKKLDEIEKDIGALNRGYTPHSGLTQDVLTNLVGILHEISDDIESLKNRSHHHHHDNY